MSLTTTPETAPGAGRTSRCAARSLLRHEVYDHAAMAEQAPFATVDDVLESILRVVASGGRFSASYGSGIDSFVSRVTELTKEPLVPQRIYSSWGIADSSDFPKERVLVLVDKT